MCLCLERVRVHIRNPDLDWAEPLLAKPLAVARIFSREVVGLLTKFPSSRVKSWKSRTIASSGIPDARQFGQIVQRDQQLKGAGLAAVYPWVDGNDSRAVRLPRTTANNSAR